MFTYVFVNVFVFMFVFVFVFVMMRSPLPTSGNGLILLLADLRCSFPPSFLPLLLVNLIFDLSKYFGRHKTTFISNLCRMTLLFSIFLH